MKQKAAFTGTQALDRALDLFMCVVADEGRSSVAALAEEAKLPLSTVHRILARFEARGLLVRVAKGRYRAGLEIVRMNDHAAPFLALATVARPLMRQLAHESARTVHLGVLEADMVTYLVKELSGAPAIFTREAMQLEAYCSAIGKVLLSHLEEGELAAYLANGPFVRLTDRTLTDPCELKTHLLQVRRHDYAIDDREIDDEVWCLAVPIRSANGRVLGALSSSGAYAGSADHEEDLLQRLRQVAALIEDRIAPSAFRQNGTR